MTWNHRIMRKVETINGVGVALYGFVEAHYSQKGDTLPHSWTEDFVSPVGETLDEFIKEVAWMFAAMRHPVIDENGKECAPALMLADDIQKWVDAVAETKGEE